ncbi:CAP domain-containing protein [Myxococcus sp. RHSTA-1-4]|uniref:CAP domain-containing protein n=1 Tax=Myxococcus sp. RHSTA-1-4 TaxID=2874601 RepID=UPI001CBE3EFA|nr:CAP domain-containing protein [Myxococcus sp. RHSTA-1-4]MBZ4419923.1 CAP domain-containing protein [Myxococcus sp. RHSTA-1-4]
MIALLALGAFLAAAPPSAEDMERRAGQHVVREFERVGRRAPAQDARLTTAARRLAREALTEYTTGAPDLLTLTQAVSDAGGADPSPRTLVIRAWAPQHAIETFLARTDFNTERASHFGVGVAVEGERAALLLLMADRKAELQPFPRVLAGGEHAAGTLCGHLVAPLRQAEIYVTRPDGAVDQVPIGRRSGGGAGFCTRLEFGGPGIYTVEVIGRASAGPEVAALFLTQLGLPARRDTSAKTSEPTTPPEARQAVYERINALRRAHRLPELTPDPQLERVAQDYSDRMSAEGFFAHVAPDGSTLTRRLPADSRYVRAGENLGLAPGPLAAHFGIEHSPGHRRNLLDPGFRFVGVGVTFQKVDGREEAVLTEVFTVASPAAQLPEDPQQEAYDTLARLRASRKLPPLRRSPALEALARAHAKRALELDQPSAQPAEAPLHDRVFQALPDAGTAAVDFFIVADPTALPESRSLADATNNLVGVGVVLGDSKRFGRRQYWVAVIYAAVP